MSAILSDGLPQTRAMTEADIEAVMTIERRAYAHPWTAGILRDCLRVGYLCRVLEDENGILGYGIMSVGAGEAHILNICVAPERHRQGLGRLLLTHLIEVARRLHTELMLLEVRPSNRAAIALYSATGFNEVGRRKGYYPAAQGREDAVIYALSL